MLNMKRLFLAAILLLFFLGLAFFYFDRQVHFSHGTGDIAQSFEIKSGEGVKDIAESLESNQLIKNKYYFDYYIWKTNSKGKIQAGKYELKGSMTIPEIVQVLSIGEVVSNEVKTTFPEGISAKAMADILKNKGFDGDKFLEISKSGAGITADYEFLKNKPERASLEGFLFPDTYIFFKNAKPEDIINRMLLNFDEKITSEIRDDIGKSGHSVYEIVTMASILEKEVKTADDMKIASGIFWDRLQVGMPLQSDATVEYILGNNDLKHSLADIKVDSPYNTYKNKGLPPGPIDNPGINALQAAVYPTKTDYNYFLTDPSSGKTIFSKTLEEHAANKAKYGL